MLSIRTEAAMSYNLLKWCSANTQYKTRLLLHLAKRKWVPARSCLSKVAYIYIYIWF